MKIKPEDTQEECNSVQTIGGIENRIKQYSQHNGLVHTVFQLAKSEGLSLKDTYILLAYHALIKAEAYEEQLIKLDKIL